MRCTESKNAVTKQTSDAMEAAQKKKKTNVVARYHFKMFLIANQTSILPPPPTPPQKKQKKTRIQKPRKVIQKENLTKSLENVTL